MPNITRLIMSQWNRRVLVMAIVAVALVIAGTFFLICSIYRGEKSLLEHESASGADTIKLSVVQSLNQVDSVLLSIRMFYLRTGSVEETLGFIKHINLTSSIIDDIFLIDSEGRFLIPQNGTTAEPNVADRDYFKFQKENSWDRIHISSVEKAVITGQYRFRVSRRIQNSDGSFGGTVVATIDPRNITLVRGVLNIGSSEELYLVGTLDRDLRAQFPTKGAENWATAMKPELWNQIGIEGSGSFEYLNPADGISRVYQYRKIESYPLTVMVGFSETEIQNRVDEHKRWIFSTAAFFIMLIIQYTASSIRINSSHEKLKASNDKLNAMNDRLEELALYDHLTGLPSRLLFADRVSHGIRQAERSRESCILLFMDLDGFKEINDTFGHGGGDFLLKILSDRMAGALRPGDTVSRWGGDEFVILLTRVSDNDEIMTIVQRLMDAVCMPATYQGLSLAVSGSFGVAKFPENGQTLEELQESADAAMYEAKNRGKNQVVFASELSHDPS